MRTLGVVLAGVALGLVAFGLFFWSPSHPERLAYLNGVQGTHTQGSLGNAYFVNDFVPRDSYARTDAPPYRFDLPPGADRAQVTMGRGCDTWTSWPAPDEVDTAMPRDHWDWLVMSLWYGNGSEVFAWRFADGLGDGFLVPPECAPRASGSGR